MARSSQTAARPAPAGLQASDPAARARLRAIVHGAAHAFCHYGFARTQMADIAAEAQVALGTLYRYAPSKDALFQMALLAGVGADDEEIANAGAGDGDLFEFIQDHLIGRMTAVADLEAAVTESASAPDPARAFFAVFYDMLERLHRPLRMLDRSSREWPELSALFNDQLRAPALRAVERFLVQQRAPGAVHVQARLILETSVWFAMHRRFTPDAPKVSDQEARQVVLDFVAAALRRSGEA